MIKYPQLFNWIVSIIKFTDPQLFNIKVPIIKIQTPKQIVIL